MGGTTPFHGALDDVAGSPIAGLDPRTRLLAAFGFAAAVIALDGLPAMLAALLPAAALVIAARLPLAALRHRLLHVEGFMLVLLVLLPFTTPGTTLVSLGPIQVSEEGLWRAVAIILKVNAIALASFALLGSIEPVRIGWAASKLGAPLKLVHLFLFVVRYVGVFRAESRRLLEAMRARAFAPRLDLHTWRSFGNLVGLMLVRSLDRAERVEEAMRCRGFAGRFPMVASEAFRRADLIFAIVLCAALGGLVAADRLT
ncbi:MAG: cobalt ECF transporter T component CbiQ [Alphaproteobacteria bacterium]